MQALADVQRALERRARALQTELGMIETRIQKDEHDYITSTRHHGNVVRGWDAFARRALLGAVEPQPGDTTTGDGLGARTSTNRLAGQLKTNNIGATTRAAVAAVAGMSNRDEEDDDDNLDENNHDEGDEDDEKEEEEDNAPAKHRATADDEGVVEQLQRQQVRRVRNADRVFSASSSSSRLRREKAEVAILPQRRVPIIGGAVKKKRKRGF